VIVVGAGVVGLTCAVRLLEDGHDVHVLARDLPLETTSAVAAALWYPYRAYPVERVTGWAAASYARFAELAGRDGTGVRMREGTEVFRQRVPDPWWLSAVPELGRTARVPPPYVFGWTFRAPVVEMPVYLTWLAGRVEEAGGTLTRMALSALPGAAEVVVDAAGLGARRLAQDPSVLPVRGQVVLVGQVGLDRWWLDSTEPTYVVPRSRDVVVGGTEDEEEWERRADPAASRRLLARAVELVPELERAPVLGHRVGLRPVRPSVRLDSEPSPGGGLVVHCYGHGGAGVTVSWGCADEMARLVAHRHAG
jgi:D-amino-acid oxidase